MKVTKENEYILLATVKSYMLLARVTHSKQYLHEARKILNKYIRVNKENATSTIELRKGDF